MKEFWNERYGAEAFAYGEEPNQFFKDQIDQLVPGKILLPAEGEGRNAVYAAKTGWKVDAFDLSASGKQKAEKLALKNDVFISYRVGSFEDLELPENNYDAIGLIYAHFAPNVKSVYHQQLVSCLKPGGYIILEAFSKSHLQYNSVNPQAGGPKNPDMLFSVDEIQKDFPGFEMLQLAETVINLQEGLYHNGEGSVIRFIGRKL